MFRKICRIFELTGKLFYLKEGQLLAEGHGLYFEETSAKSGDGIDKVFNDIGMYEI